MKLIWLAKHDARLRWQLVPFTVIGVIIIGILVVASICGRVVSLSGERPDAVKAGETEQ